MSDEDCDPLPPAIIKTGNPGELGSSPGNGLASNPAPPLSKLMALRDALWRSRARCPTSPAFGR
ncbi:hypothetical protein QNM99_21115 [Pseudomonas sp. PCH446]